MCLKITHIPTKWLVEDCYKVLGNYWEDGYCTAFMSAAVPENGWLLPRKEVSPLDRDNLEIGQEINGGCIHAFCSNEEGRRDWYEASDHSYPAIAVEVLAWGESNSEDALVCSALFIPKACLDRSLRTGTEQKLRIASTRAELIAGFPFLSEVLKKKD